MGESRIGSLGESYTPRGRGKQPAMTTLRPTDFLAGCSGLGSCPGQELGGEEVLKEKRGRGGGFLGTSRAWFLSH